MKENIHPKYEKTTITCACGNVIETGSTKKDIRVEICSKCHPFFTGKQKLVDTGGRVDRFKKRFGMDNNLLCNCLGGTLCRLVYFTETLHNRVQSVCIIEVLLWQRITKPF